MTFPYKITYDTIKIENEIEEGNIEYKLSFTCLEKHKDKNKEKKLISQMLWRLNEGKIFFDKYLAYYVIGIGDDGYIKNINLDILNETCEILENAAKKCDAYISNKEKIDTINGSIIILTIEKNKMQIGHINEIRICFLGNSNSGKSTLMSYLAYDQQDNGKGCGRYNVMTHRHEHISGMTSSIKYEIIGFNKNTKISYDLNMNDTWQRIIKQSDRIISLIDLPGHQKYIKTFLHGFMSNYIDYCIITISVQDILFNNNLKKTLEYIKMCELFNKKIIFVITKIDLITNLNENIINIIISYYYNNKNNYPIFYISCINNKNNNLNKLINYLKNIKNNNIINNNKINNLFTINKSYNIPDIGNIVHGILKKGEIDINSNKLKIGPINNCFHDITIKSIYRKCIDSLGLQCNDSGTICYNINNINNINNSNIKNKNLVIISDELVNTKNINNTFQIILYNKIINLKKNTQYIMFCANIIKSVIIINININKIKIQTHDKKKIYINQDNDNSEFVILYNGNELFFGKLFC